MVLGMSIATFTAVHVVISLIGIATGVDRGGRHAGGAGFRRGTGALPRDNGVDERHRVPLSGSSRVAIPRRRRHLAGGLAITLVALYVQRLAGSWRWIYVTGAVLALYLNVFVGVVQAFQRVPFLRGLAPTQSEPPFFVAQLLILAIFVLLGTRAVVRFRPVVPEPLSS